MRGSQCPTRAWRWPCLPTGSTNTQAATLRVIGITGTNGKTTTAYLLRSILEASGQRCGVLGTVVYSVGREDREATRTTPEAPDVQQMFREMLDNGCAAAVMEVSSHALALKRVDGVRFAAGVFSNLTRDHLDFHGDMETYFAAKRRLFEMLPEGAPGVVNVDDPKGQVLAGLVRRPVTYGIRNAADVTPEPFDYSLSGLRFTARTPRGALAGEVDARRASPTSTTCWLPSRQPTRWTCHTRPSSLVSSSCPACLAGSRLSPSPPTTSVSSWTTRTRTTRSRTCSRPRACCLRAGSSRCLAAAAIAIARSVR